MKKHELGFTNLMERAIDGAPSMNSNTYIALGLAMIADAIAMYARERMARVVGPHGTRFRADSIGGEDEE